MATDHLTESVNTPREWSSPLTGVVVGALLYESLSGFSILVLPFSLFNQFSVLIHTAIGLAALVPTGLYCFYHWQTRRHGSLNHYQFLGYASFLCLFVCIISGLVLTIQSFLGPRITAFWDITHLITGIAFFFLIIAHIAILEWRGKSDSHGMQDLRSAKNVFYRLSVSTCILMIVITAAAVLLYPSSLSRQPFSDDYNWRFGQDRPFAPSLARLDYQQWQEEVIENILEIVDVDKRQPFLEALHLNEKERQGFIQQVESGLAEINAPESARRAAEPLLAMYTNRIQEMGAVPPQLLAGSKSCGSAGCHEQIYEEWLPSAHRYSSLDHLFQKTQELMAVETSPEQTRYCAGCHDPISLFGGAKNHSNITLSLEGADEGASCVVCHSIVTTDTQGNADYTLRPPVPYLFEYDGPAATKWISDFLIRAYPHHHVNSYSRPLYKTAEYCGACHKQYIDKEVNTDIGRVQGQNQYDSWRKSRWYDETNPERSLSCRECHMPLQDSLDPSAGDPYDFNRERQDGKHRSHSFLASNQHIPLFHDLPGAERHTQLTEKWLRGEYEVPEIADRWTTGPVVLLEIAAPESVAPGDLIPVQIVLVNNKTGHDFPTGPLDMIESWLEVKIRHSDGEVLFHGGSLDSGDEVLSAPIIFKADGFDREGGPIDRHNLWDLVGAKYKRSMFPGFTDTVNLDVLCPSTAERNAIHAPRRTAKFEAPTSPSARSGSLNIEAVLWYRKANVAFLKRIYGEDTPIRTPVTAISRTEKTIVVNE